MLGRAVFVTENDVFLGDKGGHSRAEWVSSSCPTGRGRRNLSPGVSVGFTHTKGSRAAKGILTVVVPVDNSLHSTAGDSELTEERGDHDGHEGELDARVLLFSSADRRFREWEDVVLGFFRLQLRRSSCHTSR